MDEYNKNPIRNSLPGESQSLIEIKGVFEKD